MYVQTNDNAIALLLPSLPTIRTKAYTKYHLLPVHQNQLQLELQTHLANGRQRGAVAMMRELETRVGGTRDPAIEGRLTERASGIENRLQSNSGRIHTHLLSPGPRNRRQILRTLPCFVQISNSCFKNAKFGALENNSLALDRRKNI